VLAERLVAAELDEQSAAGAAPALSCPDQVRAARPSHWSIAIRRGGGSQVRWIGDRAPFSAPGLPRSRALSIARPDAVVHLHAPLAVGGEIRDPCHARRWSARHRPALESWQRFERGDVGVVDVDDVAVGVDRDRGPDPSAWDRPSLALELDFDRS
jgi:hypothetical protein